MSLIKLVGPSISGIVIIDDECRPGIGSRAGRGCADRRIPGQHAENYQVSMSHFCSRFRVTQRIDVLNARSSEPRRAAWRNGGNIA
jgi:hypothetical protein